MTVVKLLVPVLLTAMLLLSGCSKQPPVPTIPDATIAVIETTAETEAPEVDVTGAWVLDYKTTETNLQISKSLQGMFGTGLQEGNGMNLGADGTFDYYIGICEGGEGTYTRSGAQIEAQFTPYCDMAAEPRTSVSLTAITEGEETWLVMELFEENLYWKRA